ncbi:MAG: hypothetical protein Kow0037_15770 [Calditrichia bacterium]
MCKLKIVTVFLVLVLFILPVYGGQTGKIAGKVTDATTGEPLIGANILIEYKWVSEKKVKMDYATGATTDMDGTFYIINLSPGLYDVSVSYIGYREEIRSKVAVQVDKTTRLDFALEPAVIQGENVVVTAYKATKVEKDVTATKQTYDIDDVQAIAGVADITDILELQADVVDDHFRGGRVGESLYLMGGGSIVNPLNNERAFKPIVTGLQQVEVYTSGFSAEYGNAQSGVVNMVTREGSDSWSNRLEISGTVPYHKTWNGSVYDPDNLYFYNILKNTEEWLKENPTQPGRSLFDAGYGFGTIYLPERNVWPPDPLTHEDSLHIAVLGQILWLQSVRDVGLKYNDRLDYRVDFTTGGPIAKNAKVFFAGRQEVENPVLPTSQPNVERQGMGNVVYQPSPNDKFKLGIVYDWRYENVLGSNWLRYMFDRTLGVAKTVSQTVHYEFDWKHLFSQSSFMDAQLKYLDVLNKNRIELLEPGEYRETYGNLTNWVDYTGPSYHQVGKVEDDWGNEHVQTYEFRANYTSQVNKYNLIKTGVQFAYYDLDVKKHVNVSTKANERLIDFHENPYEGAWFIQDKMEFEGMIANLGLRFDFYNLNTEYYKDIYSPLRNPYFDPNNYFGPKKYDPDMALKEKTDLFTRLQPRIGFSFPISENSVFHLNYGSFTQRPNFNQLLYDQIDPNAYANPGVVFIDILGNPRLKPEKTNAYDVGLVQGMPFDIRLDVSAYYKDVKDLVQLAYFKDSEQNVYTTYVNRDYADIKGFHISLERVSGKLRGYVRYNYEVAKGKTSNSLAVPTTFVENSDGTYTFEEGPEPADVYLDYDRTHKAVFNLRYSTGKKFGFALFNMRPLSNINFSTTLRVMSGRPYTFDETGRGLQYTQRTPWEREMKLRLEKRVNMGANNLVLYAEVFNLLDEKFYHYSRTFDNPYNTAKWHNDRDNILTYTLYEPYTTRQDIYLLRNEPRHYRFGLIFKF